MPPQNKVLSTCTCVCVSFSFTTVRTGFFSGWIRGTASNSKWTEWFSCLLLDDKGHRGTEAQGLEGLRVLLSGKFFMGKGLGEQEEREHNDKN